MCRHQVEVLKEGIIVERGDYRDLLGQAGSYLSSLIHGASATTETTTASES